MSSRNTNNPCICPSNGTRTTTDDTFLSAQTNVTDETSYYSQIDPTRNSSFKSAAYESALSKTYAGDPCEVNAPLSNQTLPRPRSPVLGRRSPTPTRRAPTNETFARSPARANVTFNANGCDPCGALDSSGEASDQTHPRSAGETFAHPASHGAANKTFEPAARGPQGGASTSYTIRKQSPNVTESLGISGIAGAGASNQTYTAPGRRAANQTFTAPGGCPANQTFTKVTDDSYVNEFRPLQDSTWQSFPTLKEEASYTFSTESHPFGTCSGTSGDSAESSEYSSSFERSAKDRLSGAGLLESFNQTCPGARRPDTPRPGGHSLPAGHVLGRSRHVPTEESYEYNFRPVMASTWESFPSQDSSLVPFADSAGARPSNQTYAAPGGCPANQTFAKVPDESYLNKFRPLQDSTWQSFPTLKEEPTYMFTTESHPFGTCSGSSGAASRSSYPSGTGALPGGGLLESFNQTYPGALRPALQGGANNCSCPPNISGTVPSSYSQSSAGDSGGESGKKLPSAGFLGSFNQTYPGISEPAWNQVQTYGSCPANISGTGPSSYSQSSAGGSEGGSGKKLPSAGFLGSFNQTYPGISEPAWNQVQTYGSCLANISGTGPSSYSQSSAGEGGFGGGLPGAGMLESFNQTYPGSRMPAQRPRRETSLPAGQRLNATSCDIGSFNESFRPLHDSTWNSLPPLEESSWMPGQDRSNPFKSSPGASGSTTYSRGGRDLPDAGLLGSFNQTYPGALRPALQGGANNCSCPPNISGTGPSSYSQSSAGGSGGGSGKKLPSAGFLGSFNQTYPGISEPVWKQAQTYGSCPANISGTGPSSYSQSSAGEGGFGGGLPGAGMLESFNQTYPGTRPAPRPRRETSLPAGQRLNATSCDIGSFNESFRPLHASTWNSLPPLEESSWMPGQDRSNPFKSSPGASDSTYSRGDKDLPDAGYLGSFNQTYPRVSEPVWKQAQAYGSCPANISGTGPSIYSQSSSGGAGSPRGKLRGAGLLESFNQTYPGAERPVLRPSRNISLAAGQCLCSADESYNDNFRPPHASTWQSFSALEDTSRMPGASAGEGNPFSIGGSSYNTQGPLMSRSYRGGRLQDAGYLGSFNQTYPGAGRAPQIQGGNENCTC